MFGVSNNDIHVHTEMCIIQYISLYVTQGLSSRLHIGLRPHPNGLLRISDYAALTGNAS